MGWFKTVGCDCPECGPDPCTAGCPCTFFDGDLLQFDHDETYDWTPFNIIDHDIEIVVFDYAPCDGPTDYNYQITVWADGIVIYGTGSTTGNMSDSVTVPAGTEDLRIEILYYSAGPECEDSGAGEWYVQCA